MDEADTILRDGQAVTVVLSLADFARLTARRRRAKVGFAKHLFGDRERSSSAL